MTTCRCGDCKWWDRTPESEGLPQAARLRPRLGFRRCLASVPKWALQAVVESDVSDQRHVNDTELCETFVQAEASE